MKTLTILLFDDIEVMDFAGPFEVFSVTNELLYSKRYNERYNERQRQQLFDVQMVAKNNKPIRAKNGLVVVPDCCLRDVDTTDWLIIPGGDGTRAVLDDPTMIDWIQRLSVEAEQVASVCSGALLLAKAGLLNGLQVTTHHQVFDELAALVPDAMINRGVRFTDNGKVLTSAGISAGIDMSLHLIEKHYGAEVVQQTIDYMEYR